MGSVGDGEKGFDCNGGEAEEASACAEKGSSLEDQAGTTAKRTSDVLIDDLINHLQSTGQTIDVASAITETKKRPSGRREERGRSRSGSRSRNHKKSKKEKKHKKDKKHSHHRDSLRSRNDSHRSSNRGRSTSHSDSSCSSRDVKRRDKDSKSHKAKPDIKIKTKSLDYLPQRHLPEPPSVANGGELDEDELLPAGADYKTVLHEAITSSSKSSGPSLGIPPIPAEEVPKMPSFPLSKNAAEPKDPVSNGKSSEMLKKIIQDKGGSSLLPRKVQLSVETRKPNGETSPAVISTTESYGPAPPPANLPAISSSPDVNDDEHDPLIKPTLIKTDKISIGQIKLKVDSTAVDGKKAVDAPKEESLALPTKETIVNQEVKSKKERGKENDSSSKQKAEKKSEDKKKSTSDKPERKRERSSSADKKREVKRVKEEKRGRSKSRERDKVRKKSDSRSRDRGRNERNDGRRDEKSRRESGRSEGRRRSPSPLRGKDFRFGRRSRSPLRGGRSRSPATGRARGGGGRGRSRSRSGEKIDKKKLLEIAMANTQKGQAEQSKTTVNTKILEKAGGKSIGDIVNYCQQLSATESEERQFENAVPNRRGRGGSSDEEDSGAAFKPTKEITINIANSQKLPTRTPQERLIDDVPIRVAFPVSSGAVHRESEWKKVDPAAAMPTVCAIEEQKKLVATSSLAKQMAVQAGKPVPPPSFPILPPPPPPPNTIRGDLIPPPPPPPTFSAMSLVPPPPQPPMIITPSADQLLAASNRCNYEEELARMPLMLAERVRCVRAIEENPNDFEARRRINELDERMRSYGQGEELSGRFSTKARVCLLSADELEPRDPRFHAWVRKDHFKSTEPILTGVGMRLMEKMGWKQGEGLGRDGHGDIEPLALDVKYDRKGLVSEWDVPITKNKTKGAKARKKAGEPVVRVTAGILPEKNPISALMEIAQKKHWPLPEFDFNSGGSNDARFFVCTVKVNGVVYSSMQCNAKKSAKTQVAQIVLDTLGYGQTPTKPMVFDPNAVLQSGSTTACSSRKGAPPSRVPAPPPPPSPQKKESEAAKKTGGRAGLSANDYFYPTAFADDIGAPSQGPPFGAHHGIIHRHQTNVPPQHRFGLAHPYNSSGNRHPLPPHPGVPLLPPRLQRQYSPPYERGRYF